jgi:signal transduction histidine kinase/HAMP domain-containing protein
MRLSLKTKQVAGVTSIVGLAVVLLSSWYLASLARVLLSESRSRADLLGKAVYQRTFAVLAQGGDPYSALREDGGLRSILESSVYSANVVYAVIVDANGVIVADALPSRIGESIEPAGDLAELVDGGAIAQLRAIYTSSGRTFELREPLMLGGVDLGSIRIGVSMPLIRQSLREQLAAPLLTALLALVAATLVAMVLAQLVLRPIHVIGTGLARLGQGELDVSVDLPRDSELGDLGQSFRQVSARLAAGRSELAGQRAALESVADQLEDAVALFADDGTLLFANAAMRPAFAAQSGALSALFADGHPYRQAVERSRQGGTDADAPESVAVPGVGERFVITHPVEGPDGRRLGVLLVSRNLAYLSQVESTLKYSRKLAALSRITAGIAHEIKNPLNATMIHLELLKMQLADAPQALEHVNVIDAQVRRLDEVVQGFLKFTRPEDLRLQPVSLASLFDRLAPVIRTEAEQHGIDLRVDIPTDLPPVPGDVNLLEPAFLNLALNACQAMAAGGRLTITARPRPDRRVQIDIADTGVGIPPADLPRIFDLYFTTKARGSGIGLSLVYRSIQLHDGDIEVESVPGRGTTFRIQLPCAQAPRTLVPAS